MPIVLPLQDPCYFCEIIHGGGDRWNVVAEDAATMTLLNGRQYEAGQCMVVPMRHAATLLDLTPAEDSAVMAAARRVMQVMIASFDVDGVLLYQNNGVGSGQEVPHFHLHVVPRRSGSDWGLGPPHLARLQPPSAPRLDFTAVTDAKRQTVETLRRAYRGNVA